MHPFVVGYGSGTSDSENGHKFKLAEADGHIRASVFVPDGAGGATEYHNIYAIEDGVDRPAALERAGKAMREWINGPRV